jgi:hypothetical protein
MTTTKNNDENHHHQSQSLVYNVINNIQPFASLVDDLPYLKRKVHNDTTTTTTTTTNINTTTTTTYHNSTTNITDNDHHQSDKNNNQYNGPSEDDLTKIRDFHLQVGTLLGEDYAKVIHFDQWKDDVSILNEVIHWLGYKNCNFNAIVHENDNGYGVDSSTIIDLGKNCHYPFINE